MTGAAYTKLSPGAAPDLPAGTVPRLVGVIHLGALPGSPGQAAALGEVAESAARDARALEAAGFDAVVVENFGDAPFFPGAVPPITVAAMTRCALAVRAAAPSLALGINVLRNDAEAALAVAVAAGARFVRINVHIGARVTDQGLVEGAAHRTLRSRRELGRRGGAAVLRRGREALGAARGGRPIGEEAHDLAERGLADAVLVTGSGTGRGAARARPGGGGGRGAGAGAGGQRGDPRHLARAGRGARGDCRQLPARSGRAGDPIDAGLAARFAEAFRARSGSATR